LVTVGSRSDAGLVTSPAPVGQFETFIELTDLTECGRS
jgi:hypothetical protein